MLRFDYRGVGDSSGDTLDGTVDLWCDDVHSALDEVEALSGLDQVHLVGLRLGATIAAAALASPRRKRQSPLVRRFVLWDPVLAGDDFLKNAARFQVAFLQDVARFPSGAAPCADAASDTDSLDLLGYPFSGPLRRSLSDLHLPGIDPWPRTAASCFVLSEPSSGCEALAARLRASNRSASCEVIAGSDGAWDDYARFEKTLRTGQVVRTILGHLDAGDA